MKVVITGKAEVLDRETHEVITDVEKLKALDGTKFTEESCIDYLDGELFKIGMIGGYIELQYNADETCLNVITSYNTSRKLKKKELNLLFEETVGQWSDGLGESGFDDAEKLGIIIDLYPVNGEQSITQFDDGIVVKKPKRDEMLDLLDNHRSILDAEEKALDMIRRGASVKSKNRYGHSILFKACCAVFPRLVEELLKRGALEHEKAPERLIPYVAHWSSDEEQFENSIQTVKILLDYDLPVDGYDKERGQHPTPTNALMWSANRNNIPLAKYLLSKGANINAQQNDHQYQFTALFLADKPEMVRFLLENGADPHISTSHGKAYDFHEMQIHCKNTPENLKIIKSYM